MSELTTEADLSLIPPNEIFLTSFSIFTAPWKGSKKQMGKRKEDEGLEAGVRRFIVRGRQGTECLKRGKRRRD